MRLCVMYKIEYYTITAVGYLCALVVDHNEMCDVGFMLGSVCETEYWLFCYG